jgi:hypothetical protein
MVFTEAVHGGDEVADRWRGEVLMEPAGNLSNAYAAF